MKIPVQFLSKSDKTDSKKKKKGGMKVKDLKGKKQMNDNDGDE